MQNAYSRLAHDIEQEYRAIESALLDNPRGRWFLAEHGRRARRLDTVMLEEAIGRLQSSIRQPPALLGQLQHEIEELKQFLRDTKSDLVSKPQAKAAGSPATDAPPDGILRAAEDLHELAWSLQSNDINSEACEKIARQASAIYALSLRQALESERMQKLAFALDQACARLSAVLETITHESQVDNAPAGVASPETPGLAGLIEEQPPIPIPAEAAFNAVAGASAAHRT
jgi:hypothetical protein